MLSITLLGPVSATVADRPVRLAGMLGRTTLATLALNVGQVVSANHLIDVLWGAQPPSTAREQVHNQVSKLRRALRDCGAADVVRTEITGYRLAADPGDIDVTRVRTLSDQARDQRLGGCVDGAVALLRRALRAWRGDTLGGVTAHLAGREAPPLEDLRLAMTEQCLRAELDQGRCEDVIVELTDLVRAHPLRESLHRMRMLALHRCGRRADALAAFRVARDTLRDELGMDPSPELRDLERQVLCDGAVDAPRAAPGRLVPAQLPPRLHRFVGRDAETATIRAVLDATPAGAQPRVVVLAGPPGVGKTALATHVASLVAPRYPDGQLYVDLKAGHEHSTDPYVVLGEFLSALSGDGRPLPVDLDGRAGEFRTWTAGRRLLIVLDNAASEDQVEPLLAAEPGCATIITSRNTLPGLDTPDRVDITPVDDHLAWQILDSVAGPGRLAGHDTAGQRVVAGCAGLPLALRIAGARLASCPNLSVDVLAAQLSDSEPLAALSAGNKSVAGSLARSFRTLTSRQQRAICRAAMLGPTPFGAWVFAPLLDTSAIDAECVAEALATINLMQPATGSRYRINDLVRAYVLGTRTAADAAAVLRLVDWTVALTRQVYGRRRSTRCPGPLALVPPRVEVGGPIEADPLAWLADEWPTIAVVVELALSYARLDLAAEVLANLEDAMARLSRVDEHRAAVGRLRQEVPARSTRAAGGRDSRTIGHRYRPR